MVFQEHDATMVPGCVIPLPLHERVHGWIWQTLAREGANMHMGFDLPSALAHAGLTVEDVRAEAVIQTPNMKYRIAAIIRAMLPRIIQQGVASEAEVDIESLEQRLSEERTGANATYVTDVVFGAWARKPANTSVGTGRE
jgi:hypothetical protein